MAKKKNPKKNRRSGRPKKKQPQTDNVDSMRLQMEKQMADLGKLLSAQEFDSIEEANEFLQQFLNESGGVIPQSEPETPLEEAQEVMYEAFQAGSKRQRVKLARKALKISPDCADAYVLLADETARTPQVARELYEKAVAAGERALGPELFEEAVGHFWGITETRPYMRARFGLANLLEAMGEMDEAIEHYQEMLRLNPGDNQGVRYTLLNALLRTGADEAAAELLAEYEDDAMAGWLYSRALLAFRQEGPGPVANAYLEKALEQNEHVPDYLLGKKRLPRRPPAYVGWGDENEAQDYVGGAMDLWRKTTGALAWLAQQVEA